MSTDRFGNEIDATVGYARGDILSDSAAELRKTEQAHRVIGARIQQAGPDGIYNFTSLERKFPVQAGDIEDEMADSFRGFPRFQDDLEVLVRSQLGADGDGFVVGSFNRAAAAIIATQKALVRRGERILSVSPVTPAHASVTRGARLAEAEYIEVRTPSEFVDLLASEPRPALAIITGVTVYWDSFEEDQLIHMIDAAHEKGVPVLMDDAAAGIREALKGQRPALALGADLTVRSTDKMGYGGIRAAIFGGRRELAERVIAWGAEHGMEAQGYTMLGIYRTLQRYDPESVRQSVAGQQSLKDALVRLLPEADSAYWYVALTQDDLLDAACRQRGLESPKIVPLEAGAAMAVLLVRDHGILTVPVVSMPGLPQAVRLKPHFGELERAGGPEAVAQRVKRSFDDLADLVESPSAIADLLGV